MALLAELVISLVLCCLISIAIERDANTSHAESCKSLLTSHDENCPITFIGHSIGGLVVQAVCGSRASTIREPLNKL